MNWKNSKIKLVIWDLDETFWDGVLTEGGISYRQDRHDLVTELAKRGIISSICSKNDRKKAERVLADRGLLEHFVFTEIAFEPKGQMVKRILGNMGLRAENTLFVDDNTSNLNEVIHFCPGIHTSLPEASEVFLDAPALKGGADPDLERLNQYKLLEKKGHDRVAFALDYDDFLKYCDIRVLVIRELAGLEDRIHDLINRSNQLNYTKKRLPLEDVQRMLKEAPGNSTMGAVRVIDRYGDHGICGFFRVEQRVAVHFLFSCRVLNLGIPSWVFDRLGRPGLEVVGEVSEMHDLPKEKLGHIREITEGELPKAAPLAESRTTKSVLVVGGCDLEQVVRLLPGQNITTEFAHVNDHGVPVHREHTEILTCGGVVPEGAREALSELKLFSAEDFQSKIFSENWDVLVYSPLNDYSRGLYKIKTGDWVIPFDAFAIDWTNPSKWKDLPRHLALLPRGSLKALGGLFEAIGPISPDKFRANIIALAKRFGGRRIIILTGAEVDADEICMAERGMCERHRQMNAALGAAAAVSPNITLCDVRDFVSSTADITDNIRHYRPSAYVRIAEWLGRELGCDLPALVETGGLPVKRGRSRFRAMLARCVRAAVPAKLYFRLRAVIKRTSRPACNAPDSA